MTRAERATAAGLPLALAGLAGLAGALLVGWLASGIGPVASAAALDPDPSPSIPLPVLLAVMAIGGVLLAAELALVSIVGSRGRTERRPAGPSRLAERAARLGNVPLALGVRAALPSTGTGAGVGASALLGGAFTVIASVIACVVFSSNLSQLVGTPARFGWPFDAAIVIGFGYGGADEEAIAASLDREEVERWGLAALPGETAVDGVALPAIAGLTGFEHFRSALVAGTYPTADHQIALGARSAKALGADVGDEVVVTTAFGERDAQVVGLMVLPSLGPFLADRAGLGTGALLSQPLFDAIVAQGERDRELPAGSVAANLGTFVTMDLRDGADPARLLSDIRADVPTWDVNSSAGFLYGDAVRPPEIADVAAVRSAPIVLAALLGATMSAALASAIVMGTRARRRELAILRALGCTGPQLRSTVRWHALAVVGFGLAGGILVGMSGGSITWRGFAERLGVSTSVSFPLPWMGAVVAVAVLVALGAGSLPRLFAYSRTSVDPLRSQ
jgi:hypothetical protein